MYCPSFKPNVIDIRNINSINDIIASIYLSLILLIIRTSVVNNAANYYDPWHDEKHLKQMRPVLVKHC